MKIFWSRLALSPSRESVIRERKQDAENVDTGNYRRNLVPRSKITLCSDTNPNILQEERANPVGICDMGVRGCGGCAAVYGQRKKSVYKS